MIEPAENPGDNARQETVIRILETAERLFRVFGYSKTNVADIARELGTSPANVYRYYRSKAEIHHAIAERMLAGHLTIAQAIAAEDATAEDRLMRYAMTMHQITVETMLDEEKVHEMVIVAMDQQWGVIEAHIQRNWDVVAGIVADGIARGEFPPQDAELAGKCFCAAVMSLMHPQAVAQCPAVNSRASAAQVVGFAIRALKFNPASAS